MNKYAFNKFKDGHLTRNQKRNLTGSLKPIKKSKPTKILGNKKRYYCPVLKEGYWAGQCHTNCQICNPRCDKDKQHEIILFDKKKGHTW